MKTITIVPPFQTAFNITTNCSDLIDFFRLKYGNYISTFPVQEAETITAIKKGNIYSIAFLGETICDANGALAIDRIMFEHTRYDEEIYALHGGAVEWEGKASMLLAPTTSGKSTLTSYLTSRGFGYISDDCILLDRTSFEIYPYTTPIHLRSGGLRVLEACGVVPVSLSSLQNENMTKQVYTPLNCVDRPIPLHRIFFIHRTENENSLSSMNTTERMIALMKSPITPYSVTSDYLSFLSKLSKIDCYELRYCEMNFVAEVLENEQCPDE